MTRAQLDVERGMNPPYLSPPVARAHPCAMFARKTKPAQPDIVTVVEDEEPIPVAMGGPARDGNRVEPIEIEDNPAPLAKNDKRTKQQLLELIAKYEAESKTFKRRLEANEEFLQHQRTVDNRAGKELYEATKAELDQAKSELAMYAARDRRLRARVLKVRDELIKLRDEHGYNPVVINHVDSEMQAVGEKLVDLTQDP